MAYSIPTSTARRCDSHTNPRHETTSYNQQRTILIYKIYQILILLPVTVLSSAFFGTLVAILCPLAGWLRQHLPHPLGIITRPDWWGAHCTRWWSKSIIRASLLPIEVMGRENIPRGKSCVFVANHQGAYDIFLVCGYLGVEIRWMLKRSLEKIPFVGIAARHAGYIFVDKGSNAGKMRHTYRMAEDALRGGASLMLFPEGSRTTDGTVKPFHKGAFALADELQLPVVPMTINGSFDVLPRQNDGKFIKWHKLSLTIHAPIYPQSHGTDNIERLMRESYEAIRRGVIS